MLFDEVVFKKKSLVFVARCDVFNGSGPAYEKLGLYVLVFAEIGCKTVFQILGLSDIYDGSAFIAPHVDTALIWCFQCSLMKDFPWGKRFC